MKKCKECGNEFNGYGSICKTCRQESFKGSDYDRFKDLPNFYQDIKTCDLCSKNGVVRPDLHTNKYNIPELDKEGACYCLMHYYQLLHPPLRIPSQITINQKGDVNLFGLKS